MSNVKAIALLSGGLDSRLAIKLMIDQGIEVLALNFTTCFCTCTPKSSCRSEARQAAEKFGIKIKIVNHTDTLLQAVKDAKHGYGRGINPCIDCRIAMFKAAAKEMESAGASFIITGEVLGERPMSQRIDAIHIIEGESGLKGKILRPLSARLFEPTDAEKTGIVDRDKLLAIKGRSRKPQIKLAEEIGIKDYPCPAGGCLLTDKAYAGKLRNLLQINSNPTNKELNLLKVGRHFFIDNNLVVIGRNEVENERINNLREEDDLILKCQGYEGPTTLVKISCSSNPPILQSSLNSLLEKAAALTARYSQGREESVVTIAYQNSITNECIDIRPSVGYELVKEITTSNS